MTMMLVGALKIMQFIMRKPDVFPNDYYALWLQAHDEAMAASPYAQEQFRKIIVSKRSRVNDNDAAARARSRGRGGSGGWGPRERGGA